MKPRSIARLSFPLTTAIAALLAAPAAVADVYYWDSDSDTAGFGNTVGTWGTSAFWTTVPGGGATHSAVIATTTSDTVNFGSDTLNYAGATAAVAAGGVSVGNITVGAAKTGGINVGTAANTITLAAAATIIHSAVASGNALTISSLLAGAATSLTKAGPGTVILSGNSAGFGVGAAFNHTRGLVRLTNANALGGATGATINMGDPGAVNATSLDTGASINITNPITILASSAGTLKTISNGTANAGTFSGNITADDHLTIAPAANSSITVSGLASTIATGKTVSFTNGHASAAINDSAIWGGLGKTAYSGSSGGSIAITGLKGYSGGATLGAMSGAGVVSVNTSSDGPANAPTSGPFGTSTLSIGATKVRAGITEDITVGNSITFTGNPTFSTIAVEKSLIFTGTADLGAATRTLTCAVGSTVGVEFLEFSGVISSATPSTGLTKAGAGTLKLSGVNTYSGGTTLEQGTLSVGTGGTLSATTGTLSVNNTNSTAAGTAAILNLATDADTTTGSLSGTLAMPLTGTNTATINNGGIGRNFTVNQTTDGSFSGVIAGDGGFTLGSGSTHTLTLTGNNTYLGGTTVSAGTLALGASNVLDNTTAVSIGAATLAIGAGFSDTAGTLAVTGAASLNLGAAATMAFAHSNGTWSGTLNITGTFVSGSSLKFGTTNTGLAPAQLALISATGFTGFGLDANGFLTATPAGGYIGWQTANGTTQTIDLDHDSDGVSNGVEYFLGGNTNTTGFTALPGVDNAAGVLSVTWTKAATYPVTATYGTDFVVETSATLAAGSWATVASPGTVTITGNNVKYTFPVGTKNFARLKVTGP